MKPPHDADQALLTLFGCLHDGTLEAVRGEVPGTVLLRFDIEYLAEMIRPGETMIDVILEDCRVATFELYGGPARASLVETPTIGWTVLGADMRDGGVEVSCAEGILRLSCGDVRIQLGSGQPFEVEDLRRRSLLYWEEWERRARDGKPRG